MEKSHDVDTFLFFLESGLPLPMAIVKLRNKQIIWLLPSSLRKKMEHGHDNTNLFLIPLQSLSYRLADKIVLYSQNLINEWKLNEYSDKILFAHEHFINTDKLKTEIPFTERMFIIGYIGRLNKEKGVQNFIQSLPAVIGNYKHLNVLVVGDGPLKGEIEMLLFNHCLTSQVSLPGWILPENLPQYLNKLRLLILPSYTEGLPNIMLEAMTCGTPVLATPVGAIPDIITDGETGFIMENNSSTCITKNIIRALENPNLEKIAKNAKKMVDKKFSFEGTVNQWKELIRDIPQKT
jgi:glycosyltransferase involved in cell wall biosynthesis